MGCGELLGWGGGVVADGAVAAEMMDLWASKNWAQHGVP